MSVRLDPTETHELLTSAHTGILTTSRADGRPVTLPVWFVLLDGVIYLQTPPRAKKVSRARRNPHGTFLVERGQAWAELTAWHSDVDIDIVTDEPTIERVLAAIDDKYAAYRLPESQMPSSAKAAYAQMTVLALTPVGKVLSWANNKIVARQGF